MAVAPDHDRQRASREATDWLILLQEDPDDPHLLQRFEAWLHNDPANEVAWEATQRTADAIATVPPTYSARRGAFAARQNMARSALSPHRRTRRRRTVQLAGLAVAACLALLFAPNAVLRMQADFATGTAETRQIRLDDGSAVSLAPDTAIAVAYIAGERRVRLLRGEAFFEVTPNPDRPFRVASGDIAATVLGTAFDVRRTDGGTSVAVEHGVVRVDCTAASPPVSERLEAGQSVRVSWLGQSIRADQPPGQAAPWRKGQLIALDRPMHEVVDRLRPYVHGTIILADRAMAARPITGVYNLSDPVEALRGIAGAHGGTVRRITPWVLVVSGD